MTVMATDMNLCSAFERNRHYVSIAASLISVNETCVLMVNTHSDRRPPL